nr:PadR family transcriptional regulator [Candidatus Freyarchaeota archaeon]
MSLSSTDICILGIVNEKPRYGYEIEKIIEHRGIRNWVDIEFSSVYNTLNRLERKGLLTSETMVDENNRSRKIYRITPEGLEKLKSEVINCLQNPVKQKSTLDLGLANLPVLSKSEILASLNMYLEELSSKKQFFEERISFFIGLGNDLALLLFERPYRLLLAEMEWLLELVKRIELDKVRLEILE